MILTQVKWLVEELNLLRSRLHLEIVPMYGMSRKSGHAGMVTRTGNKIGLAIDTSLSLFNILKTICHEMIHVKQMATGKLKLSKRGAVIWCGKRVRKTDYMNQPWEKDAFVKQEVLFADFLAKFFGIDYAEQQRKI